MALAFFEIILDQCFALLGMKFTSASFLSAVMNSAPSITFVMAVILGGLVSNGLKCFHRNVRQKSHNAN
ncbi:WAT1-related protein [Vigna unguiculata]|uniref:WAT1-related protein n=1 Tax=Vigna unguiculata TaxID=3917 RepID=A0A4D6NRR3_VIGUN|nr:WAT1-related protein [Vigna unguiculata]